MAEAWTTADYAFVVSLCSASISLISLGWNVWSKFIFPKPKLSLNAALFVTVKEWEAVVSIDQEIFLERDLAGLSIMYPAFGVEITNCGNQPVAILDVFGERGHKLAGTISTSRFSLYKSYPPHPDTKEDEKWIRYGALCDSVVKPGEPAMLFFPVTPGLFNRYNFDRIVVRDGFQRHHVVNDQQLKKIRLLVDKFVADPET